MKEYNPGKFLRELFPEQTSSPVQILKWLPLYLANVALVFGAAWGLGLDLTEITYSLSQALILIFLVVALMLFSAEVFLWNRIRKLFRKE